MPCSSQSLTQSADPCSFADALPSRAPQASFDWFTQARYGMFIHWGPYAAIGRGEQVIVREQLDQIQYEQDACRWNPQHFDAEQWASVAKAGGFRYAVLTTRHHDGYCLWDSKLTDYTSVQQAPQRDFVAQYVQAFRQAGLRVGLYYSLNDMRIPACFRPVADDPAAWEQFRAYVHGQVRELLTQYGQIDVLWFDGAWPHDRHAWQSERLVAMIRELQPGILINNRLDSESQMTSGKPIEDAGGSTTLGDFGTPEHQIIADPNRVWESCQTSIWRLWGHTHGQRWRSADQMLDFLAEAASKGGNLLLNVGPDPQGRMPEPFVEAAATVGRWLDIHGQAIYSTQSGDVTEAVTYGYQTQRDNDLFLIFRFWDTSGSMRLVNLASQLREARLLSTGQEIAFMQDEQAIVLEGLPRERPSELFPVIRLRFGGKPRTSDTTPDRLWSGDPRKFLPWVLPRTQGSSNPMRVAKREAKPDAKL